MRDASPFRNWDTAVTGRTPKEDYSRELRAAREESGVDEPVQTADGFIRGRRAAVIFSEFTFLGVSISLAAVAMQWTSTHARRRYPNR